MYFFIIEIKIKRMGYIKTIIGLMAALFNQKVLTVNIFMILMKLSLLSLSSEKNERVFASLPESLSRQMEQRSEQRKVSCLIFSNLSIFKAIFFSRNNNLIK